MEVEKSDRKSNFDIVKILKNFSFLTIGKLSGDIFTFLLFVYLTRTYGEQGIGDYSFAMGYVGFFVVFADFGLYHYSIRELSRSNEFNKNFLNNVFSLRLIFCLLIILLVVASTYLLDITPQTKQIIIILGIYQILCVIVDGFMAVFVAEEKMHVPAFIEFSFKTLIAIICIVLCSLSFTLVNTLLAFPIIAFIFACISYYSVSKLAIFPKLSINVVDLFTLTKKSISFCFSSFLTQISTRTDVVMLGLIIGTVSSGIYNISYRVIFLMLFIAYFASIAIYPLITRLYNTSRESLGEFYEYTINLSILVSVPAAAGLCLISNPLIELLFGPEYDQSGKVLAYLAWLFPIVLISSVIGIFLTATDQQNKKTKSQWYAAYLNVLLNIVLIYQWREIGAAIATIISELLLVILFAFSLKNLLGLPKILKRLAISLGGTFLFSSLFLIYENISVFILILPACLIYFTYLMIFRDVRENELKFIVRKLNSRA